MSSSSKSSSSSKASASTTDAATPDAIPLPEYEAALEVGYIGVSPDGRPNEDYTVQGVIARAGEGPPDITAEVVPAESS